MVALVGEGHLTPAAEQVAAKAGVGLRTVFRHFSDMESLYAGMAERLAGEYRDWQAPFAADDWRGQLIEMRDRRLGTYERLMPYKRAADVHRHASLTIQRTHAATLATMRARLEQLLPAAIVADPVTLETLDLMLSFEVWQRLRLDQGLSSDAARAVIARAIERLTAGVSDQP